MKLWDVVHEKSRASLAGHAGDVLAVTFSPDGLTLAWTGRDQAVRLWDPVTARELLTLSGHQAPVHAASFSPDGTIVATDSHDGAIKRWRAPKSPLRKMTMTRQAIEFADNHSRSNRSPQPDFGRFLRNLVEASVRFWPGSHPGVMRAISRAVWLCAPSFIDPACPTRECGRESLI